MSRKLKDWIKGYLEYTENQESPTLFHLWSAIAALSAATLRNVWLDFRLFKVFTNFYIILVAPPGRCKKSTSLQISHSLINQLPFPPNTLSQKITPQALISALSRGGGQGPGGFKDMRATGLIYASELGSCLDATAERLGVYILLCDLYDCPDLWSYETVGRGKEVLRETGLNIYGGTTPRWIRTSMPSGVVGEGFAARVVFVYQEDTSRVVPLSKLAEVDRELEKDLIADLAEVQKLKGTMKLSEGAYEAYELVVKGIKEQSLAEGMMEYSARRPMLTLRTAALISISRGDSLVVDTEDVVIADGYLVETERGLAELYRLIQTTQRGDDSAYVLRHIAAKGELTRTALMRDMSHRFSGKELDVVIGTLEASGGIQVFRKINPSTNRYTTVYKFSEEPFNPPQT